MGIRKFGKVVSFLFLLVMTMTACTQSRVQEDHRPVVYTSFYPIQDITQQVAQDLVDVRTFMSNEEDPHFWEPTPKNMKELGQADLLIVNGANLEKWVDQVRDNYPDLPVINLAESVELITYKGAANMGDFQYMTKLHLEKGQTYHMVFGHTHEDIMRVGFFPYEGQAEKDLIAHGKTIMEAKGQLTKQKSHIQVEEDQIYTIEMGHEQGLVEFSVDQTGDWIFVSDRLSEDILAYVLEDDQGQELAREDVLAGSSSSLDKVSYDPHSWLSIVNAKIYANTIMEGLIEVDKKNARNFQKNKVDYVEQLTNLEVEYLEKFKDKRIQEFVTTHNAYGYIARDFDLIQFPLTNLVSSDSPSLKTIRTALDFCEQYQVHTIFYEEGREEKSAQTLAQEIHGDFVPLVSMEYLVRNSVVKEPSYLEIMRYNLEELHKGVQ